MRLTPTDQTHSNSAAGRTGGVLDLLSSRRHSSPRSYTLLTASICWTDRSSCAGGERPWESHVSGREKHGKRKWGALWEIKSKHNYRRKTFELKDFHMMWESVSQSHPDAADGTREQIRTNTCCVFTHKSQSWSVGCLFTGSAEASAHMLLETGERSADWGFLEGALHHKEETHEEGAMSHVTRREPMRRREFRFTTKFSGSSPAVDSSSQWGELSERERERCAARLQTHEMRSSCVKRAARERRIERDQRRQRAHYRTVSMMNIWLVLYQLGQHIVTTSIYMYAFGRWFYLKWLVIL